MRSIATHRGGGGECQRAVVDGRCDIVDGCGAGGDHEYGVVCAPMHRQSSYVFKMFKMTWAGMLKKCTHKKRCFDGRMVYGVYIEQFQLEMRFMGALILYSLLFEDSD